MKLPGILVLPQSIRVLRVESRFVEAERPDGLRVFFDLADDEASQFLNKVRLHAPAEVVLRAVGTIRGLQISQNYARMHCAAYDGFLCHEISRMAELFKLNGWLRPEPPISIEVAEDDHLLPLNIS